jgi:hypothetical protein
VRRYLFDELSPEQVESLGQIARTVVGLIESAGAGRDDACDEACD